MRSLLGANEPYWMQSRLMYSSIYASKMSRRSLLSNSSPGQARCVWHCAFILFIPLALIICSLQLLALTFVSLRASPRIDHSPCDAATLIFVLRIAQSVLRVGHHPAPHFAVSPSALCVAVLPEANLPPCGKVGAKVCAYSLPTPTRVTLWCSLRDLSQAAHTIESVVKSRGSY